MRWLCALAVLMVGCSGSNCTVESIGEDPTLPDICVVSASCDAAAVTASCPQSGAACTCSSDTGARPASGGHATCAQGDATAILKLCGWGS